VFLFAANVRAPCSTVSTPRAEGSSSTRLVTLRSTSLMFRDAQPATPRLIRNTHGRAGRHVGELFGGIYKDPRIFFAQFAVDPESYLRMYPEIPPHAQEKTAFLGDRASCQSSATAWRKPTASSWATRSR